MIWLICNKNFTQGGHGDGFEYHEVVCFQAGAFKTKESAEEWLKENRKDRKWSWCFSMWDAYVKGLRLK
jgi:hypothetical protein